VRLRLVRGLDHITPAQVLTLLGFVLFLNPSASAQTCASPCSTSQPATPRRPMGTTMQGGIGRQLTNSPASNLTGLWIGQLLQPDGPIASPYTFQLNLAEDSSGNVTGTTYSIISNEPTYYVQESISGAVSGNVLTFQQNSIISDNSPPGSGWCVGSAQLTLSTDGTTLSGDYQASGCAPATISLTNNAANSGSSLGNAAIRPGGCVCGDPINIGSGNLFEQVTDYETSGLNKLKFVRYYNSSINPSTFAIALGPGWRGAFDRYIRIISTTSVVAERADGETVGFVLTGGVWQPNTDVDITLTNSGATWMLTDADDAVETYTTIGSNEALLNSIRARSGYTQTLAYDATNDLSSVTDSFGRSLTFTYQNGILQTLTTPDGLVASYKYLSSPGRLASATYSTSPETSLSYLYENSALPFALTGIVDEDGNQYATWTYDSSGRPLSSQHATGADLMTVSYDDTNGSRTVTNALGQVMVYQFATFQGVPMVTEIDRQATATTAAASRLFTYDSNGYLAGQTDWNGNTTTYVNDTRGEPTTINEAVGTPQARTTGIMYLSNYHLPSQIVTPGLTTNFTYDSSGDLLTKTQVDTTITTVPYSTNGQSRTWTYTWSNFLLASALGPRTDASELTKFAYDSTGALTATTNALGQMTKITQHLPGGLPQTVIDPNGVTTSLTYDARQRLLTSAIVTSAGTLTTKYTYDPVGNLLSVTLPDGSALSNTYDAAHRLIGITDLFNDRIAYTLDALGDRSQTRVANTAGTVEREHSATFDALGRFLKDIGGAGQTTAYVYDSNGNALAITDPLGRVTEQAFDPLNRPIALANPLGGGVMTGYDAHNRPTSVIDPSGNTTTYAYDGFGDVIQQASPVSGSTVYRYDLAGNLLQRVDSGGTVSNFTYDPLDRLLTTIYPGDTSENVAYNYDQSGHGFGIGRLTSATDAGGSLARSYDERGDLLTELRVNGATTMLMSYTYDAAGRVSSIMYPSGAIVAYTRDAMGRITSIATTPKGASNATTIASKVSYEPFGPAAALTYGNGIAETRTFDLDYRMTAIAGSGGTSVQNLGYGYDAANNVLSITDHITSGNSQAFQYDELNRLTGAQGGYGTLGYSYGPNGDRLTENPTSTATPSPLDALGTVTALTYNQAGRLAAADAGSQQLTRYTYDAFGHRLLKVGTLTPSTLYQYDPSGNLLEEDNIQSATQNDYVYLDGRPIAEITLGHIYFFHDDRLGTPQLATNTDQAIVWVGNYQPFGALNTTTSQTAALAQDLRLPGQENDIETGLYHNGFRDYVPNWGRYAEGDPIGLAGGLNGYVYVNNQPTSRTDPSGTQGVPGVIYGVISGGIGGAITGYASGGVWGAVGGAVLGGAIGGAIGFAVPEFSSVAANVATQFVVGGLASYAGQVSGNSVGYLLTGQGSLSLTNNINPGAIIGSAAAGALGPVVNGVFAALGPELAEGELATLSQDLAVAGLDLGKTLASVANGTLSGLSESLGGSLYDSYKLLSSGAIVCY
jgi:RHS repeat-associated protein